MLSCSYYFVDYYFISSCWQLFCRLVFMSFLEGAKLLIFRHFSILFLPVYPELCWKNNMEQRFMS